MTQEDKQYLDSLKDDELYYLLSLRYGITEPIWEECSQKEFEHSMGKIGAPLSLENVSRWLSFVGMYKAVPCYKDFQPGILWQIKNFDRKPDYYKYYKQVGSKFVLMLGSEMMDYLNERKPAWLSKMKK